ncbi:MAG: hypothetical protein HFE97_12170 [Oscillospiraceae bacterium]|nr:hypothetical protein [Oscillospiraceae bacterium]
MRELYVNTQKETGSEAQLKFDYYILIDQMEVNGGLFCESYGIKIVGAEESISIPNLTTSIARIDGLMELLIRNFVTPTTAMDVVNDWL